MLSFHYTTQLNHKHTLNQFEFDDTQHCITPDLPGYLLEHGPGEGEPGPRRLQLVLEVRRVQGAAGQVGVQVWGWRPQGTSHQ